MSKIRVYTKPALEGGRSPQFATGANTVVEINGQKLSFCTSFKLEIKAGELAKISFEVIPQDLDLEIDGVKIESE